MALGVAWRRKVTGWESAEERDKTPSIFYFQKFATVGVISSPEVLVETGPKKKETSI